MRGKAALITGSTSNIGRAIAIRFAAEGAGVVVTGRDVERGRAVVEAIHAAGDEATFIPDELDGSVEGSQVLAKRATDVYGTIDILVNNAGIYPPDGTLAIDSDTFGRVMAVNVKAPYFLTAELVPAMAADGGGVVLNLGSWGTRLGIPAGTAYASSKGAMETLTRAWAAEFGPRGVWVNAISPGVTFDRAHPMAELAGPLMETSPLGRLVTPDAIARRRCSWPATTRRTSTAPCWTSTVGAPRCCSPPDDHAHGEGCGDETAHHRGRRRGDS